MALLYYILMKSSFRCLVVFDFFFFEQSYSDRIVLSSDMSIAALLASGIMDSKFWTFRT